MEPFTLSFDNAVYNNGATLGLNGLQLNPETTFASLDTVRPAFTFAPEKTDFGLDMDALKLSGDKINALLSGNPYTTAQVPATDITGATNNIAAIMGDYYGGLKATAQRQQFMGATLNTVASAVNVFNNLISWNARRKNINMQRDNTKLAIDNAMAEIDNQVLYAKNKLMDKFGNLVANNAVNMAAANLKVSSGALLELSKETANDITMDFRTLESNAELKKISLRNQKKQAEIAAKVAKTSQVTNFVNSAIDLGLNVATGGGTGQTWGQLYSGYKQSFQAY